MAKGLRLRSLLPKTGAVRSAEEIRNSGRSIGRLPVNDLVGALPSADILNPGLDAISNIPINMPDLGAEAVREYTSIIRGTRGIVRNRSGMRVLKGLWRGISAVLRPFKNMADAWASGNTLFLVIGGLGRDGKRDNEVRGLQLLEDAERQAHRDGETAIETFVRAAEVYIRGNKHSYGAGRAWQRAAEIVADRAMYRWRHAVWLLEEGKIDELKRELRETVPLFQLADEYYIQSSGAYPQGEWKSAANRMSDIMKGYMHLAVRIIGAQGIDAIRAVYGEYSGYLGHEKVRGPMSEDVFSRWQRGREARRSGNMGVAASWYRLAAEQAASEGDYVNAGRAQYRSGMMLTELALLNGDSDWHAMAAKAFGLSAEMFDRIEEKSIRDDQRIDHMRSLQAKALVNADRSTDALKVILALQKRVLSANRLREVQGLMSRVGNAVYPIPGINRQLVPKAVVTTEEFRAQQKAFREMIARSQFSDVITFAGEASLLYDTSTRSGKYRAAMMWRFVGEAYEGKWKLWGPVYRGVNFKKRTIEAYEKALRLFEESRFGVKKNTTLMRHLTKLRRMR